MSVRLHTIEGNVARHDGDGWAEKQAVLIVTGLSRTLTKDDLVVNALAAVEGSVYAYGSAHPDIASLYCLGERTFRVVSGSRVDVDVTYRRKTSKNDPNYVGIRFGVSLVTEKTNVDYNGDPIALKWKPSSDHEFIEQAGEVDVQTPCLSLEFTWRQTAKPGADFEAIVGYTNAAEWQNAEAEAWLCVDCNADSPDSGEHWNCSARFVRNAKLWKQTVYYVADNGRPPANYAEAYQEDGGVLQTVKEVKVFGTTTFPANIPSAYEEE
jgi:hypothetical protein